MLNPIKAQQPIQQSGLESITSERKERKSDTGHLSLFSGVEAELSDQQLKSKVSGFLHGKPVVIVKMGDMYEPVYGEMSANATRVTDISQLRLHQEVLVMRSIPGKPDKAYCQFRVISWADKNPIFRGRIDTVRCGDEKESPIKMASQCYLINQPHHAVHFMLERDSVITKARTITQPELRFVHVKLDGGLSLDSTKENIDTIATRATFADQLKVDQLVLVRKKTSQAAKFIFNIVEGIDKDTGSIQTRSLIKAVLIRRSQRGVEIRKPGAHYILNNNNIQLCLQGQGFFGEIFRALLQTASYSIGQSS